MKYKELKSKSKQELESQLSELEKELVNVRKDVARGTTLKNPHQVKNIKKNIARILTELNKK